MEKSSKLKNIPSIIPYEHYETVYLSVHESCFMFMKMLWLYFTN